MFVRIFEHILSFVLAMRDQYKPIVLNKFLNENETVFNEFNHYFVDNRMFRNSILHKRQIMDDADETVSLRIFDIHQGIPIEEKECE